MSKFYYLFSIYISLLLPYSAESPISKIRKNNTNQLSGTRSEQFEERFDIPEYNLCTNCVCNLTVTHNLDYLLEQWIDLSLTSSKMNSEMREELREFFGVVSKEEETEEEEEEFESEFEENELQDVDDENENENLHNPPETDKDSTRKLTPTTSGKHIGNLGPKRQMLTFNVEKNIEEENVEIYVISKVISHSNVTNFDKFKGYVSKVNQYDEADYMNISSNNFWYWTDCGTATGTIEIQLIIFIYIAKYNCTGDANLFFNKTCENKGWMQNIVVSIANQNDEKQTLFENGIQSNVPTLNSGLFKLELSSKDEAHYYKNISQNLAINHPMDTENITSEALPGYEKLRGNITILHQDSFANLWFSYGQSITLSILQFPKMTQTKEVLGHEWDENIEMILHLDNKDHKSSVSDHNIPINWIFHNIFKFSLGIGRTKSSGNLLIENGLELSNQEFHLLGAIPDQYFWIELPPGQKVLNYTQIYNSTEMMVEIDNLENLGDSYKSAERNFMLLFHCFVTKTSNYSINLTISYLQTHYIYTLKFAKECSNLEMEYGRTQIIYLMMMGAGVLIIIIWWLWKRDMAKKLEIEAKDRKKIGRKEVQHVAEPEPLQAIPEADDVDIQLVTQ